MSSKVELVKFLSEEGKGRGFPRESEEATTVVAEVEIVEAVVVFVEGVVVAAVVESVALMVAKVVTHE